MQKNLEQDVSNTKNKTVPPAGRHNPAAQTGAVDQSPDTNGEDDDSDTDTLPRKDDEDADPDVQ